MYSEDRVREEESLRRGLERGGMYIEVGLGRSEMYIRKCM